MYVTFGYQVQLYKIVKLIIIFKLLLCYVLCVNNNLKNKLIS